MKTITDIFRGTKTPATVLRAGIVQYIKHSRRMPVTVRPSFVPLFRTKAQHWGQLQSHQIPPSALRAQSRSFSILLEHYVHHTWSVSLDALRQKGLKKKQAKKKPALQWMIHCDLLYYWFDERVCTSYNKGLYAQLNFFLNLRQLLQFPGVTQACLAIVVRQEHTDSSACPVI